MRSGSLRNGRKADLEVEWFGLVKALIHPLIPIRDV
jgi:hypothetical protein